MRLSAVQLLRREQNKAKLAKNIQFNYQIKIKICIFAKIYYGWFDKSRFYLQISWDGLKFGCFLFDAASFCHCLQLHSSLCAFKH